MFKNAALIGHGDTRWIVYLVTNADGGNRGSVSFLVDHGYNAGAGTGMYHGSVLGRHHCAWPGLETYVFIDIDGFEGCDHRGVYGKRSQM